MKIGMLYPHREQCGIAIYSREVTAALTQAGVEVLSIDSDAPVQRIREQIAMCSLLHVQYETGLYMRGRRDIFRDLLRGLTIPVVVSLHELYEESPFVYPRRAIAGRGIIAMVKRLLWDVRHPVQRAESVHCRAGWYATRIPVFYRYQRDILERRGIAPERCPILEKPVPVRVAESSPDLTVLPEIRLGIIGFVNPSFDVDLLFAALEKIERPWVCTWVGGIPTYAAGVIAAAMRKKLAEKRWEKRFIMTGWVSEERLAACLDQIDIVLALFKNRSTSDSISRALGSNKPVIATPLPLTVELANAECDEGDRGGPILLAEPTARDVVAQINRLVTDRSFRERLYSSITTYNRAHTFSVYAGQLVSLYRECCAP